MISITDDLSSSSPLLQLMWVCYQKDRIEKVGEHTFLPAGSLVAFRAPILDGETVWLAGRVHFCNSKAISILVFGAEVTCPIDPSISMAGSLSPQRGMWLYLTEGEVVVASGATNTYHSEPADPNRHLLNYWATQQLELEHIQMPCLSSASSSSLVPGGLCFDCLSRLPIFLSRVGGSTDRREGFMIRKTLNYLVHWRLSEPHPNTESCAHFNLHTSTLLHLASSHPPYEISPHYPAKFDWITTDHEADQVACRVVPHKTMTRPLCHFNTFPFCPSISSSSGIHLVSCDAEHSHLLSLIAAIESENHHLILHTLSQLLLSKMGYHLPLLSTLSSFQAFCRVHPNEMRAIFQHHNYPSSLRHLFRWQQISLLYQSYQLHIFPQLHLYSAIEPGAESSSFPLHVSEYGVPVTLPCVSRKRKRKLALAGDSNKKKLSR